jgi:hypothetical protein
MVTINIIKKGGHPPMIDKRLIPVGGLKKEPFSGSHNGMRYYMCADEDKENFTTYIYPEPWSFEKTPGEERQAAKFPISEDGMDAAIAWLFKQYEGQKEKWHAASKNCMHIVNQSDT